MGYFVETISFLSDEKTKSRIFADVYEANAEFERIIGNNRSGLREVYPSEGDESRDLRFLTSVYDDGDTGTTGRQMDYFLTSETPQDKQKAIDDGFIILKGSCYEDIEAEYAQNYPDNQ